MIIVASLVSGRSDPLPGRVLRSNAREGVLGIAPSTYYAFKAVERDPERASGRARQDRLDMAAIKKAFDGSRGRYGARKV
jgi:hypothetical protein